MRRTVARWLPPLVWMGLIFFVSAQPSVASIPGRWDLLFKKTTHVLAYAVLTALYLRALRGTWSDDAWVRLLGASLAFTYAVSDEFHQTFVPGRNGTLIDVVIDGIGVSGVILGDWWYRSRHRAEDEQPSQ